MYMFLNRSLKKLKKNAYVMTEIPTKITKS